MDYALMALVQILYVALNSLRVVFMIKGRKYIAAILSGFEIFVYISGLAIVLKYMDTFLGIFIYCITYAVGILVGIYIEQKIALGYITLQIVSEKGREMTEALRKKGYGVTEWHGLGASGPRFIYFILARRKEYEDVTSAIQQIDPAAFIIYQEPKYFIGGYTTRNII
ncbi:DUF2179 domain-containing protein [Aneurinibacillus danicus]|jgi:uncharacterized protein YebE (UPF0316 family)|uniref:UPF0316 protein n=1 Tax=Aneurinibacillus danicus TaxID=267746 RepID=A0A511VGY5_9BACL|nr:DUF5698 domain-containing protein [Aneurinibacillus danicus]GEN36813.1 UPF0316 protein [Aneurinibacillus danicus]